MSLKFNINLIPQPEQEAIITHLDAVITGLQPYVIPVASDDIKKLRKIGPKDHHGEISMLHFFDNFSSALPSDFPKLNIENANNMDHKISSIEEKIAVISDMLHTTQLACKHTEKQGIEKLYKLLDTMVDEHPEYKDTFDILALIYAQKHHHEAETVTIPASSERVIGDVDPTYVVSNLSLAVVEIHPGGVRVKQPIVILPGSAKKLPAKCYTVLIVNRSSEDEATLAMKID